MSRNNSIELAQAFIGDGITYDRLDQVYDLQRLMGPVIAYKILLEIAINAADPKERRLAASQLLQSADESPDKIADRLRASVFAELDLEELHAVIQTGITDPEKAVRKMKASKSSSEAPTESL